MSSLRRRQLTYWRTLGDARTSFDKILGIRDTDTNYEMPRIHNDWTTDDVEDAKIVTTLRIFYRMLRRFVNEGRHQLRVKSVLLLGASTGGHFSRHALLRRLPYSG